VGINNGHPPTELWTNKKITIICWISTNLSQKLQTCWRQKIIFFSLRIYLFIFTPSGPFWPGQLHCLPHPSYAPACEHKIMWTAVSENHHCNVCERNDSKKLLKHLYPLQLLTPSTMKLATFEMSPREIYPTTCLINLKNWT
jgi:hypothetical protein